MHPLNTVLESLCRKGFSGPQLTHIRNFPEFEKFITIMGALKLVRESGLWNLQFKSFDDYCRKKYGLSEKAMNFAIEVSEEAEQLKN
jgi:hypothetical protein